MATFTALDVETANADPGSICSIGIAQFTDGKVEKKYYDIINPDMPFDPINTHIHGISERDVLGQPSFAEIYPELVARIDGQVVVSHMPFDRVAIDRATARCKLPKISVRWVDSARVARRTWEKFSKRGYGLKSVCAEIGFSFHHHNALEDAEACGMIIVSAINEMKLELDDLISKAYTKRSYDKFSQPTSSQAGQQSRVEGPDGALLGETIVFTGSLSITRAEAANLAAEVGCNLGNSVTKSTSIIVIGDQDINRLVGYEKSSKHRKAEDLIVKGQQIRILSESAFRDLVASSSV